MTFGRTLVKMSAHFSCTLCFGFLLFQEEITYRYTRRTLWSPCKQLPPPCTNLLRIGQYTVSNIHNKSDKFKVWLLISLFMFPFIFKYCFVSGTVMSHSNTPHVTKQKLCRKLFTEGKKVKLKLNLFIPIRTIKV